MSKKFLLILTFLVLIFCTSASYAAAKKSNNTNAQPRTTNTAVTSAGGNSIGIVDRAEILRNHPDLEKVQKQLADFAEAKGKEAKTAVEKETDNNKKAKVAQEKRMELVREEERLMTPVYADCEQAVREVAARKKLTLVLDKMVVLIGGVDITQDVIQQLARKK